MIEVVPDLEMPAGKATKITVKKNQLLIRIAWFHCGIGH